MAGGPETIIFGHPLYQDRHAQLPIVGEIAQVIDGGTGFIDIPGVPAVKQTQFGGGLPLLLTDKALQNRIEMGPFYEVGHRVKLDSNFRHQTLLDSHNQAFALMFDRFGKELTFDNSDPNKLLEALYVLGGMQFVSEAQQYGDVYALYQAREEHTRSALEAMRAAVFAGLSHQRDLIGALETGELSDRTIKTWWRKRDTFNQVKPGSKTSYHANSDTQGYSHEEREGIPHGLDSQADVNISYEEEAFDDSNSVIVSTGNIVFDAKNRRVTGYGPGFVVAQFHETHFGPTRISMMVNSRFSRPNKR